MRVVMPAHPLVVLIGCLQFERLFTLLSLQTSFESDRLTASTKGYSYDKGLGLYIVKRGFVSKHRSYVTLPSQPTLSIHMIPCAKICNAYSLD